ncbi:hypothetical protein [Bosea beijingensis]|uniref:hypothetical protein n=1 Tax=Bosea beijingensis TaxID=3068632 RepID=UPI0027409726|nr:hypothetical protein [Bosea sp. REN20]
MKSPTFPQSHQISDMTDAPQEPKDLSPSDRFKALITNAESATYGLKDNLLAVMTRDGSATWQTVAAHIEAQLPGAGEFATARLNAILALVRTLSNRQASGSG